MSIKTNYFDGHTYSAADDRRPWYSLMDDGVFGIATQALKVVASSPADLSVNVQPGACIVAGYYIYSDAVVNLPIIANTSGYNRVDIVVVEVDEVNKETDIRIVQGTPTSTPTAPLPNEQQYVLAEIFVGNNVSVIENSNITDRREEAMTKTLKTHQAEFAAHLADYAKGTMIRIILKIMANSGDGVVEYQLGEEYVQSVVSSAYGIDINFKNIPTGAKLSSNFVIISSGGLTIGESNIDPFIYQRALSNSELQIGIKISPTSAHRSWDSVSWGSLQVTIAW